MTDTTPAARRGEVALTLNDLVRREHRRGRMLPLLLRAANEAFLLEQAAALGLAVEAAELQQAADALRRRRGLLSAEQTNAWLKGQRLSVDDFEAGLAERSLLAKLRRHVCEKAVAERFAANPADFDKLRLLLALLPTEDLAREVLSQAEEGRDLAALARKHSTHPSASNGGEVGPVFRCRLPAPLREALAKAKPDAVGGPVATPKGFLVARVESVTPAVLDAATEALLARTVFDDWLRITLRTAPFSAPLLGDPA